MGFLDFLGMLNLVDQVDGLLFRAKHGGARRFEVMYDRRWTGRRVEKLLRRYGIVVAGRGYTSSSIYFLVKPEQAEWAEYVMLRAGVPLVGPLVNPRNAEWAARHAPGDVPTPWAGRG